MQFPTTFASFRRRPTLSLGTVSSGLIRRDFRLTPDLAQTHWHLIGAPGSGKSRALAGLFLSLLEQEFAATLIDPHGDLAKLVLAHLVANKRVTDPVAREHILYLDIPAAARGDRYLPFNILCQAVSPYTLASNVKEAFHRAWPTLANGQAPMFDTLVQDGVKLLASRKLPLTALYRLLVDGSYRRQLLTREDDPDIVRFFCEQYDRLSRREQAVQAGAALRRAHLLTFAPVLRHSLGQDELLLDWRRIMDEGRSVIVNLALADADSRRLLGALLMVTAEQAALSRAEGGSRRTHFLIVDECASFVAQSGEALAHILWQARKFGLFLVMAHQSWEQLGTELRGAIESAGIQVAFRLGRADAEQTATRFGQVNPLAVKHEVEDPTRRAWTHPLFQPLPEQWEEWVQALQHLQPRQAFFQRLGGPVAKITLGSVADPVLDAEQLAEVEAAYLSTCFRPLQRLGVQPRAPEIVARQRTSRVCRVRVKDHSQRPTTL